MTKAQRKETIEKIADFLVEEDFSFDKGIEERISNLEYVVKLLCRVNPAVVTRVEEKHAERLAQMSKTIEKLRSIIKKNRGRKLDHA